MSDDQPKGTSDADLLATARERFRLSAEAEADLRKLQLEDKKFASGEQWPEKIKAQREEDGRPCLTIDRLSPQIKQVTNGLREARPSIDIAPTENGDVEVAEVYGGLIRHIQNNSDADVAYDQGGSDAATIGRGFFRVLTEYESDDSDSQEIIIGRIRNPFTIYFDPTCQKIDYSDARFAFVVEDLLFSQYKLEYPDSKVGKSASLTEFSSTGDDLAEWFTEQTVRVAEYWYVESTYEDRTLPNGKKRKIEKRKVFCKKINAVEVLESYEWAGKYIPIVPVIGEEVDINGKVDYRGITRRARDPQAMSNYWFTAATEAVALAPKSPVIMAEGQDEGYERQWDQANVKNFSRLVYKPTTIGQNLAPPPSRMTAEPPIQAMMAMLQASENNLRAVTGFYDVGDREGREQSGRAIMARQRMGELGNSDYGDGLRRAIRHCGRILVDLIPHIYDVPRVRRITGKDGQERSVIVHAGNPPPVDPATGKPQQPDGVDGVFDLSAGKYDVVVSAGQSFQTARQEFIELMAPMFQAKPELFQLFGDIFFENLDVPYAKQMAERAKKMLPPQLQDDNGQEQPIPPQVQMQMQQMQEQLQMAGQAAQEMQRVIETKQIEVESRERIESAKLALEERMAVMQIELDRQKAILEAQMKTAQIDAENARVVLKANADIEKQRVDLSHQAQQRDTDRVFESQQTTEA